jgi:hypothetical protein
MSNRNAIEQVLVRVLSASRLTQVRNITAAHENTWKEYLNGNKNSQLIADEKLADVIKQAIAELDDNAIKYITEAIK